VRRTALFVVAWFVAGSAAVALATAGVSMVGNQVTGSRPSSLSAAEVEAQLAGDGVTTSTTTAVTGTPGGAGEAGTSTTAPGTDGGGGGGGTEGPLTTAPPAGSGGGGGQPAPPTTSAAPPTTAPPPAADPSETRTYLLVGGTATLRFAPTGVTVVVASPNAGYAVDVEGTHGNGVRVEFRSEEHRSRVEGWWDGGPQDDTEEQD
jgi:hypothetical protein